MEPEAGTCPKEAGNVEQEEGGRSSILLVPS